MTTPQLPDHGTTPWLDRFVCIHAEVLTEHGVTQELLAEIGAEMERRALPVVVAAVDAAKTHNDETCAAKLLADRLEAQVLTMLPVVEASAAFAEAYRVALVPANNVSGFEPYNSRFDALLAAVDQMATQTTLSRTRAPKGDDCSVEPGDLHRYEACPGAARQRARDGLRTSETPQDDVPVRGQAELIQRLTERITGLVETTLREELR